MGAEMSLDEELNTELQKIADELRANNKPLPPDIAKLLLENMAELMENSK